jgi:cell division protease FtsH
MGAPTPGSTPRGGKKNEKPAGFPGNKLRLGSPLAYAALLVLGFFLFRSVFTDSSVKKVPYSEFKDAVASGGFSRVVVADAYVKGFPSNVGAKPAVGQAALPWYAVRVANDPQLVPLLEQKKISYEAVSSNSWTDLFWIWAVPLGIGALFWSMMMRRMGGGAGMGAGGPQGVMSFGKTRARVSAEPDTGVTFKDVAGIDEAVDELQEIVEFLKTPEKFRRLGGRIPKGVLLIGPPGTGKTLLARAVAGEAGVPFFSLSGSEFVEMFVGVGAARVRDLFAQAQTKAPCIIFIDELDAIGKSRNASVVGGHDEREQTLNQLLAEMDGFDPKVGLIVIAATNRPEIMDAALLRPGRFDRQVLVDRPDRRGREQILAVHAKNVKVGPDVDLKEVASRTPGFAGAELANIVNEAALLAARKGRDQVMRADFFEAIERVIAGLEKKNRRINDREKEIVAHHEAGHTVVSWFLENADRVKKVSIIPRGLSALGYTLQMPLEDRYLMSKDELRDKIAGLMGGRAAEEIFIGEISTGASNDLKQATNIARMMVREYGMSEVVGPMGLGEERAAFLAGGQGPQEARAYSERMARIIDREVSRLVNEGLERARSVIAANHDKLQRLAARLLTVEVIEEPEIQVILGNKVERFPLHPEHETEVSPTDPAGWPGMTPA